MALCDLEINKRSAESNRVNDALESHLNQGLHLDVYMKSKNHIVKITNGD